MAELLKNFNHLLDFQNRHFLENMTNQDRVRLLKELLNLGPGEKSWNAICELFASWPKTEAKEEYIDYANGELSKWGDHIRHVSSSWEYFYDGNSISSLGRIVRSVTLYRRKDIGSKELSTICKSPNLKELKQLKIQACEISPNALLGLANASFSENLTHLCIRNMSMKSQVIETTFKESNFKNLTFLELKDLGLKPDFIKTMTSLEMAANLESLDLSYNYLKEEGLKSIAESEKFRGLKSLNLKSNFIRKSTVLSKTEAANLSSLRTLDLSKNQISDAEKSALKNTAWLKNTEVLI